VRLCGELRRASGFVSREWGGLLGCVEPTSDQVRERPAVEALLGPRTFISRSANRRQWTNCGRLKTDEPL